MCQELVQLTSQVENSDETEGKNIYMYANNSPQQIQKYKQVFTSVQYSFFLSEKNLETVITTRLNLSGHYRSDFQLCINLQALTPLVCAGCFVCLSINTKLH